MVDAGVRPEYVKCILDVGCQTNDFSSWCGRDIRGEFSFVDIDHAALNGRKAGRLVACPECFERVVAALRNGL